MESFKAYDYKTSFNILLDAFKSKSADNGTMIIVVGANGSGKSTYIANYLTQTDKKIKYVNADVAEKEFFGSIEDDVKRAKASMNYTMELVENIIKDKTSFIYETVFSHPSKLDLVKKAKSYGYKIVAIYVSTQNVNINLSRVAIRASQGGHDVPKDKIISRYGRTKENVNLLKDLADEFIVFDNSVTLPIIYELEK